MFKRNRIAFPLDAAAAVAAGVVVAAPAAAAGALAAPLEAVGAVALGAALCLLAVEDWRERILPDALTLPLVLAGLAFNGLAARAVPGESVVGAAAGYAVFALVRAVYFRWRGREGLGLGDAKLLAAGGAWIGWPGLPLVVLVAALAALAATGAAIAAGRRVGRDEEIPFGVFLALAIWAVFLYRDRLLG
jgi:leader peptidase (prepilin peptidase)/N-methyltransferase